MGELPSRIYVGIDPSLRSTGIAFVGLNYCVTQTIKPGKMRAGERLKYHKDHFTELAQEQKNLFAACIEGPALDATNRADDMGQIRGIYNCALADFGLETHVIPPTTLKKFATGIGNASKEQMLIAASAAWPHVTFMTDDEADAAWLAALAQALHDDIQVNAFRLGVLRDIRSPKLKRRFRLNKQTNI
jgi:crossover junction endodeoxyribonuclease RuvC